MIVLAKMSSIFWAIFSFQGKLLKLAILGAHLYQQFLRNPHYITPIRFSKMLLLEGLKIPISPILLTGRLNLLAKYQECKKRLTKDFFVLGDTVFCSWICCAAQFPHHNFEPVDGPLKMPQIYGGPNRSVTNVQSRCRA